MGAVRSMSKMPPLKAYNGEHANCSNCYWRSVAETCTMWRLTAYWRCRHWKDDMGAGWPGEFKPALAKG